MNMYTQTPHWQTTFRFRSKDITVMKRNGKIKIWNYRMVARGSDLGFISNISFCVTNIMCKEKSNTQITN